MMIFGHLGIGLRLARPFSVPPGWLLLGTLLPDLLDKTTYYGLSVALGARGADLGLISGTRTFGHTAAFLLLLALVGAGSRSKAIAPKRSPRWRSVPPRTSSSTMLAMPAAILFGRNPTECSSMNPAFRCRWSDYCGHFSGTGFPSTLIQD
jgi:hypothetical protein